MDDGRIWAFEERLWIGGEDAYRQQVDPEVVMVLPQPPYAYDSEAAIRAVSSTPVWERVEFSDQKVHRPLEGLIVIAYRARASKGDQSYEAFCTSTIRRLEHEVWKVVQHQQTIPLQTRA